MANTHARTPMGMPAWWAPQRTGTGLQFPGSFVKKSLVLDPDSNLTNITLLHGYTAI
jgi:hypothetical protein